MKDLRCPICGEELVISIDVVTSKSRKIKNDGSLYKTINYSNAGTDEGSPYLKCERCKFTYDVEHSSHEERNNTLDNWIYEHLEELYEW